MSSPSPTVITVSTIIEAPVQKVWALWTTPHHICQWNSASPEWHTPFAFNELRVGGKFVSRMEARDGSTGFDFEGVYDAVEGNSIIGYVMADGRKVMVSFASNGNHTSVTETFEAETENSVELQQQGWQAILNNFKQHVESFRLTSFSYEVLINAPVSEVYLKMLDDRHYREWTKPFNAGSYFKGNWEKGSKILFIGCDETGKEGGMVSRIADNVRDKYVSIEHLGMYHDGKEIMEGPEVEAWRGARESYAFIPENKGTRLVIYLDITEQHAGYFNEMFPSALQSLKDICEK